MKSYSKEFNAFMDVVRSQKWLVLDTETTGLNNAEVVQIAILDEAGDTIFKSLIKPRSPIPAAAIAVHGITNELVANAPAWPEIAAKIKPLLECREVIVYNAAYDTRIMINSSQRWGVSHEWINDVSWWCAMEAYAEYYGDWNDYHASYRWQKLTDAARRYDGNLSLAHDAEGDCKLTRLVCHGMLVDLTPSEITEDDLPF